MKKEFLSEERKTARILIYKESKNHYNVIDYDIYLIADGDLDEYVPECIKDIKVGYCEEVLMQVELSFGKYIITQFDNNKEWASCNNEDNALKMTQFYVQQMYPGIEVNFLIKKTKLKTTVNFPI